MIFINKFVYKLYKPSSIVKRIQQMCKISFRNNEQYKFNSVHQKLSLCFNTHQLDTKSERNNLFNNFIKISYLNTVHQFALNYISES